MYNRVLVKMWRNPNLHTVRQAWRLVQLLWENCLAVLKKENIELPLYGSSNSTPSMSRENDNIHPHKNVNLWMFRNSDIHKQSQKLEIYQLTNEDKPNVVSSMQ